MLVVVSASLVFLIPRPATLSSATTGDAALAAQVRAAAGSARGYRGLAVAVIDRDRVRFAGLGESGDPERPGIDKSTVFEAGSLGKPMTGMLLAELASRKRLRLDISLQKLLPGTSFSDPAVASATLRELASHRAGLDLMPSNLQMFLRGAELRILGRDPYRGISDEAAFTAGRHASSSGTGRFRYSNLGMTLAGQTAARVMGKPYEELLQQYVLAPLNMRSTRTVHSETSLPPRSAAGYRATGAVMEHWLASGYTPAGDVWSTSEDLARLVRTELRGTAPGAEAAVPRFDAGGAGRIGLGWYTTRIQGQDITWHDGETGGFTSYMGFDRAHGRGVVVLSNTNQPVDAIGKRLLGLASERNYPARDLTQTGLTLLCCAGAAGPVLYVAWRRFPKQLHHTYIGLSFAFGVVLLTLVRRVGDWLSVPPTIWVLGGALLSVGFIQGIRRRPLPAGDPLPRTGTALLAARYAGALLLVLLFVIAAEL
ncbi:beta-lactamase family protein [Streptomyces caniferus]|uniref:Beta-lactamase family protein n=1 Tax=Streptomyces caniferus TaxID=285557 RepID=A0ABZ1VR92_9ACTN|nr:serine hydrolase domain-containing protein [Streptomyces caniferus]